MCDHTTITKGKHYIDADDRLVKVLALSDKFGPKARIEFAGESKWVRRDTLRVIEDENARIFDCDGCNGSGVYYGAGIVLNGVFKGYSGPCYRCEGNGKQSLRDRLRNRSYDRNYRRLSA